MSKRKNRERAESGLIFRNGSLVRKEAFYAPVKAVMALAKPVPKKRKRKAVATA